MTVNYSRLDHLEGILNTPEPRVRILATGLVVGALIVFALVAIIAAALGEASFDVLLAGFFVGLVVGGGLGFLVAARVDASRNH